MRENDLIQVLWVENDPLVTSSYPREAEMCGDLQLIVFPNREDCGPKGSYNSMVRSFRPG